MFVSGLLDEWRRKLLDGDQERRNSEKEYEDYLARQRKVWTPAHEFEKCCPRWVLVGSSRRRPSSWTTTSTATTTTTSPNQTITPTPGSMTTTTINNNNNNNNNDDTTTTNHHNNNIIDSHWSGCNKDHGHGDGVMIGGSSSSCCKKCHPSITLFFDAPRRLTVAVLSHRLDPFTNYLQGRVREGTAKYKSPLYYELDGYVRENLSKMKNTSTKQQTFFGSHLVDVAVGALYESDQAQKEELERKFRIKQRQSTSVASTPSSSSSATLNTRISLDMLETVLEICRLHRLGDDVDEMSIYCMARTSRVVRRIACRIAQTRLRDTKLCVSPYVDGTPLNGYSVFRKNTNTPSNPIITTTTTSTHREYGRLVEYTNCTPIDMEFSTTAGGGDSPEGKQNEMSSKFVVVSPTTTSHHADTFQWSCQELSFANLEPGWGDICLQEYLGQKLVVSWASNHLHTFLEVEKEDEESSRFFLSNNNNKEKTTTTMIPLDILRLGTPAVSTTTKNIGTNNNNNNNNHKQWDRTFLRVVADICQNDSIEVDEVTRCFRGSARMVQVEITNFLCLVQAFARSLEPYLVAQYNRIQETRPLLDHEKAYLRDVHEASMLGIGH